MRQNRHTDLTVIACISHNAPALTQSLLQLEEMTVKTPLKTRDVSRLLGVRYFTLYNLIRSETMTAPERDSSGDYFWRPKDIDRAKKALALLGIKKADEVTA